MVCFPCTNPPSKDIRIDIDNGSPPHNFQGKGSKGSRIVAVQRLNHDGLQGNQEFIVEVLMLSLLHHVDLVILIGYCTARDQRLLVYEHMQMGGLEDHLFDLAPGQEPLSWDKRIKIAVAPGIEYLHCKANPSVICRDLKSANIMLDNDFNPKLSDFGLAILGPIGDNILERCRLHFIIY